MSPRRASEELLADYEDFLRVRSLCQWELSDPRSIRTGKGCSEHCDSAFYRNSLQNSSEETIANIAITLIHQVDILLHRLIERAKRISLKKAVSENK